VISSKKMVKNGNVNIKNSATAEPEFTRFK
jgi:hypothetical protein